MSEFAPLPSNELIESVYTFKFLQSSLNSPNSSVKSMFILTFEISSKLIINGWDQKDSKVSKIEIGEAKRISDISVDLIEKSLTLSNEPDLIRVRFELTKELFILPDLEKDIGIAVILEKSSA